jgi:mycofactocin precursor
MPDTPQATASAPATPEVTAPVDATSSEQQPEDRRPGDLVEADLLVEDVSIDGMCRVY